MSTNIDVSEHKSSGGPAARLFAFATLAILVSGVGYVGREGYRALTDAFVAPAILSPDNDLVLQNKLRMSELSVERSKSRAELEAVEGDLAACTQAIQKLEELQITANKALVWTTRVNEGQAMAGAIDLRTLAKQHAAIAEVVGSQQLAVESAKANLEAGLISKMDFTKETQVLNQLEVGLLENDRLRFQAEMQQKQVSLARSSLSGQGASTPMPEMILAQDQTVRVELELLKLQSEKRKAKSDKALITEKLAKIDELEAQLKGRPIFRAADKSLDLAFVPYSQIDGITQGAGVYDCVWGVFACKQVGTVAEIVPGEVILPDPWGTQTRGQFAVLDLSARESAKSKTLRVRALPGTRVASVPGMNPKVAVK